jgi:hypothetical protein
MSVRNVDGSRIECHEEMSSGGRMVTIEQVDRARSGPALGQECQFAVQGEPLAAVEYFLEHERVFYPDPLRAEPDHTVRLYPEAPGRYALHAGWRPREGRSSAA